MKYPGLKSFDTVPSNAAMQIVPILLAKPQIGLGKPVLCLDLCCRNTHQKYYSNSMSKSGLQRRLEYFLCPEYGSNRDPVILTICSLFMRNS
jgi:hypothetical protein